MNTSNTLNSNKMGKAMQMPALCLALTLAAVACSTAPKAIGDASADAANDGETGAVDSASIADGGGQDASSDGACQYGTFTARRVVCVRDCTPEREIVVKCAMGASPAGGCYAEITTGNLYESDFQTVEFDGLRRCNSTEEQQWMALQRDR
jgi:hypothetical protein